MQKAKTTNTGLRNDLIQRNFLDYTFEVSSSFMNLVYYLANV